ncbi:SnoaL-like domain-containing protein [Daldinia vernicosa]|uniref:SnoaL-like domain-containing protein n=1 Tax=Daldinia vernicosa TaxID=114800 RepID=UPI0020085F61|nr:SnoaL-like domain-containing protein [Daldinia vernicosa]KAI0843933.1 SnoaL-like domain-containing protein [Daldinia vernicosa]
MAAAQYDIQTFLLDKQNIHDTVARLTLNLDLRSTDGLIKDVYAPDVVVDYTSMFGGKPTEATNEAWAKSLEPMMDAFDSMQHVVTNEVIELPQPTKGVSRPDRASVVAQVNGHMFRRAARGKPIMHNGGRYNLELVRLPELEQKGENPWRISRHATVIGWEDGSSDVMSVFAGIGH